MKLLSWMGRIGVVIIAAAGGYYFAYRSFHLSTQDFPADELAVEEAAIAVQRGITVVSCRDVITLEAEARNSDLIGTWRKVPRGEDSRVDFLTPDKKIIVVFVHGYNNSVAYGLKRGNELSLRLQRANEALARLQDVPTWESIQFVTFLWRGDFGPERFNTAERSADLSAKSLANLITELGKTAPDAKLVIIAHSLGARVALGALDKLATQDLERRWLSSLILVQPAVNADAIYKWRFEMDTPIGPLPASQQHGRFADCIRCAGRLVYTVSTRDTTLGSTFAAEQGFWLEDYQGGMAELVLQTHSTPSGDIALGRPFDEKPVYRRMPGDLHERRVSTTLSEWRIDHPSVKRIDIDVLDDLESPIENWHSPVFAENGAKIAQELWNEIIASL